MFTKFIEIIFIGLSFIVMHIALVSSKVNAGEGVPALLCIFLLLTVKATCLNFQLDSFIFRLLSACLP